MLCILYVTALSAALGLVAWLLEQTLPDITPRRWLWLAAIALSMTIPPVYVANHHVVLAGTAAADSSVWSRLSAVDIEVLRLWLVTTIGLTLWGLVAIWRQAWLLRRHGGPVIVHPTLGPATVGLLRTRIVIPAWVLALPASERHDIVRHEHEHIRAHDTRLLFFASLTVVVTPWNVALWWLLRRLSLAVEIDCDRRVLAGRGDIRSYGELLVKVATSEAPRPRLQPAFLGAGMLERRLRHMLAPRRLSRRQRVLVLAIATVMLTIAFATPHPVRESHVESRHSASAHR